MSNPLLQLTHLETLATRALVNGGASTLQATSTARALINAEAQGLASHGLSRIPMYVGHMREGRVLGDAVPKIISDKPSAVLIDAADGFAFPACELAIAQAIIRAKNTGIAVAGVTNSHHFGAAAYHLQAVSRSGLVGFAFGNSPAAMPAAGGARAIFGTNPIAAAFPRTGQAAISIDLSLSEVARGKLMVAAKKGESIPLGWALDAAGHPTTDPKAGMEGSMLPFGSASGGTKGAMLALMVELLVISLTGAHFGLEADSFFNDAGNKPKLGQVFIVIDPAALGGSAVYNERVEALLAAMLSEENVRIPGYRREAIALNAHANGISVPESVLTPLVQLAG